VGRRGLLRLRAGPSADLTLYDYVATAITTTRTGRPEEVAALWVRGEANGNLILILGTALSETVGGYLAAAFKKLLDVASPVLTAASVNQTGDAYRRQHALAGRPGQRRNRCVGRAVASGAITAPPSPPEP